MTEALDATTNIRQSTQEISRYSHTTQLDWILPIIINVMLIFVTFWLLISLIHYGVKTKKWRHAQGHADVLSSGLVYSSMIACAVSCMLRYLVSLAFINVKFIAMKDELCEALIDAMSVTYAFVLSFVGLFMWSRQRAFFANRVLNVNYHKIIKFFSVISIACIFGYALFAVILHALQSHHIATTQGCKRQTERSRVYWIVITVGLVFFTFSLLALLLYALTHSGLPTRSAKSSINSVTQNSRYSICSQLPIQIKQLKLQAKSSSTYKIKLILKRTITLAVIIILVDTATQIFSSYIKNTEVNQRVGAVVFDASAFLNLVLIILSFVTYKDMMTSPCRKHH